jgi:hypothetical protein
MHLKLKQNKVELEYGFFAKFAAFSEASKKVKKLPRAISQNSRKMGSNDHHFIQNVSI